MISEIFSLVFKTRSRSCEIQNCVVEILCLNHLLIELKIKKSILLSCVHRMLEFFHNIISIRCTIKCTLIRDIKVENYLFKT